MLARLWSKRVSKLCKEYSPGHVTDLHTYSAHWFCKSKEMTGAREQKHSPKEQYFVLANILTIVLQK
jgi:hypothetical protein